MALPGTLLGFSNLLAISTHHGLSNLPPAWMEGHGHAHVFGWIGSFILGIGFYSQPSSKRSTNVIPIFACSSGVPASPYVGSVTSMAGTGESCCHFRGFELITVLCSSRLLRITSCQRQRVVMQLQGP